MKRLFCTRPALVMLALLMPACSGSSDDDTPPPSRSATGPSQIPSCSVNTARIPTSLPAQGGRFEFTISASSTCTWTARTDVGWADVAPGSGQGNAAPMLNVNQNTTFFTRPLTVIVNGRTFQATQGGLSCSYTVDPVFVEESFEGGRAWVNVSTGEGCGWTVTPSEGWVRVLTTTGVGSATIYIELAPNTGDVRHAFITVAGQRVNIRQRRRG